MRMLVLCLFCADEDIMDAIVEKIAKSTSMPEYPSAGGRNIIYALG